MLRGPQFKSQPCLVWCYKHCGSQDKMVLVCHVISEDYLIKRSYDFMGRKASMKVNTLPSLVVRDTEFFSEKTEKLGKLGKLGLVRILI